MITCDCSVDVSFEEAPTVHLVLWRRARKPHVCCECGELIPVGALYEYVSGRWHDRWDSHITCRPCASIRDRYCGDGYIYGELRERLWDCLGMDYVTGEVNDAEAD